MYLFLCKVHLSLASTKIRPGGPTVIERYSIRSLKHGWEVLAMEWNGHCWICCQSPPCASHQTGGYPTWSAVTPHA